MTDAVTSADSHTAAIEKALAELKPEIAALLQGRKRVLDDHAQNFLSRRPPSDEFDENMWRFRNYAGEVVKRWKPAGDPLESYLELAVVDAHDAAIDALAALVSGAGAPALALFRRFYELANILLAGWENPSGLERVMKEALKDTRLDDHYSGFAERGVLGAVMPRTSSVGKLVAESTPAMKEFEKGLQSISHGGMLAGVFFIGSSSGDLANSRLEHALEFAPFVEALIGATAGASWQILERLSYPRTYQGADARFTVAAVDAADERANEEFDQAFPNAFEVVWSVLLGLSSISMEVSEAIGVRGYDPARRQSQLMQDCFETGCLAMEFLFRGRLAGSAILIRRVFEMSLELQSWARFEGEMTKRFENLRDRERTPSATSLIAKLHGIQDSANQRRTYSTLCSVAHGGMQSHEYLIDGDWKAGFRICPAPVFIYRHHRWLLGTLVSTIDAALGGALVIAAKLNESIADAHGGYLQLVRHYEGATPELGLVRNEEAELPEEVV